MPGEAHGEGLAHDAQVLRPEVGGGHAEFGSGAQLRGQAVVPLEGREAHAEGLCGEALRGAQQ